MVGDFGTVVAFPRLVVGDSEGGEDVGSPFLVGVVTGGEVALFF